MRLVLRRPGSPEEDLDLGDRVLTIGSDAAADVRVEGPVAPIHVRIDSRTIEAVATCDVGGVPLRGGGRRTAVPCVITIGETALELRATSVSAAATRDLALQALEAPELLWPTIMVVEGPGLGKELVLRDERVHLIGRARHCDLVLDDVEITREHLEVRRRGADVLVLDRQSTRGTWLGRRRLEPDRRAIWPSARMLRIGSSVLALIAPASIPQPESPPEHDPELEPSPPLRRRSDPSRLPAASPEESAAVPHLGDSSSPAAMGAVWQDGAPPRPARRSGLLYISVAVLLVATMLAVLLLSSYVLLS